MNTVCPSFLQECIIHVGSSVDRLLYAAETYELKKRYRDGTLREITLTDLHCFDGSGKITMLYFLESESISKTMKYSVSLVLHNVSQMNLYNLNLISQYNELSFALIRIS